MIRAGLRVVAASVRCGHAFHSGLVVPAPRARRFLECPSGRGLCRGFATSNARYQTRPRESDAERNKRVATYGIAVVLGVFGISYASVPLYKVFCQATGFGGTTQRETSAERIKSLKPVEGRTLRISFVGDVSSSMPWSFKPEQRDVKVVPGETALAFFRAENKTDKAITGVATYNVFPFKAGLYFHKIQCFCFEQQRLLPKEGIDMPVFFYVDPEFLDDPAMDGVNSITLSYTFFKTDEEEMEDEEQIQAALVKQ